MSNNSQENSFQIEDKAIGLTQLDDLTITDADVSLSANIAQSKIHDLPATLTSKLDKSGGAMTGPLYGVDPVNDFDAATKESVDNLVTNSVQPFYNLVKEPSVSVYNQGLVTVSVEPYRFNTDIFSTTQTQLDLISDNIEDNSTPAFGTNYYLYATSSGLKFSLTAPTIFRKHPTQRWYYISFIKTRTGTNDIAPFVKTGRFFRYLNHFNLLNLDGTGTPYTNLSTSTINFSNGANSYSMTGIPYTFDMTPYCSPISKVVRLSWSGTSADAYYPVILAIFPSSSFSSQVFDFRRVTGAAGGAGGRHNNNQGSSLSGEIFAPIVNGNIYSAISISNGVKFGQRIWLEGFFD